MKAGETPLRLFLALLLGIVLVLVLAWAAGAASITLQWDPSTGATGYHLFKSLDNGVTWVQIADVTGSPLPTTAVIQAEDGKLVLYRVSAYNANGEAIQYTRGAWYDSALVPPAAAGGLRTP